jgi:hypothetical protein
MIRKLLGAGVALALGGCASAPVDTSPQAPTAVLDAKYALNGALLPDGHGTSITQTRLDRQQTSGSFEADTWVVRQFMGKGESQSISRLDKNLLWLVDPDSKTYQECPLRGCENPMSKLMRAQKQAEEHEPAPVSEPADERCPTTVKSSQFDVKSTGEKRSINGFAATQNIVSWAVAIEDQQQRSTETRLTVDLWTTDPTAPMSDALKVMADYNAAYRKAAFGEGDAFGYFMSPEVAAMLLNYLRGLMDNPETKRALEKLAQIDGLPVSTKVEFNVKGNACAEEKTVEKEAAIDYTDPQKALQQLAGGFMKKKAEESFAPGADEPLFRYVYEMTGLSIKPVRDSAFEVPAGYKLMNRQ